MACGAAKQQPASTTSTALGRWQHRKGSTSRLLRVVRIGLLSILMITMVGCAALEQARWQEPELLLEQLELVQLTPTNAELVGHFSIRNPNAFSISTGALDYTLAVDQAEVLTGEQNHGQRLEAGEETSVRLPVILSFAELGSLVQGFSARNEVDYELSGGMRFDVPVAGSIRVPVETAGTFPIPRLPALSVQSLKVDRVSLSGAQMVLTLQLDNPNVFELIIENLSYELALDNNPVATGVTQQRVRLSPEADGVLQIPMEVSFQAAGRSLYRALENDERLAYGLSVDSDFGTSIPQMTRFPFSAVQEGQIALSPPGS